jgi:hypothetical protein
LDFMHPSHGMFTNKLDSEVDHLVKEATITDIKTNFIPTLTALVRGARAINMTSADVKQATRALVNLNTYFQDSRHWKEVWTSDIVKDTWRRLWLADDMTNAQPSSEWFRTELPTLGHFDTALELWFRCELTIGLLSTKANRVRSVHLLYTYTREDTACLSSFSSQCVCFLRHRL